MTREKGPHPLAVLAFAAVMAAMLLTAAPAAAIEQPPQNDDFPWWCPEWVWPCNWFFGGGGDTDCTQGTPCNNEVCKCQKRRHDGEQGCRSLPPYPGALQACLAGVSEEYTHCVEMARIICEGT